MGMLSIVTSLARYLFAVGCMCINIITKYRYIEIPIILQDDILPRYELKTKNK